MAETAEKYNRAAGPVQQQTVIVTTTDGLTAHAVDIPTADRTIPGYVAYPAGQPHAPVLLVLSEAFGLHEHIRDIVRRFAHQGFFAIAPDLMVRQGDPRAFSDVPSLVQNLLLKIPDAQVLQDLDSTLAWTRDQGANTNQANITGFCWGGRWTWLYAAHRKLQAAIAWYGILDGAQSDIFRSLPDLFPTHPLDLVSKLQTPVLGLYGGHDEAIPLATIEHMQAALKQGSAAAQSSRICIYPEAGHAFFADYRASYRKAAASDAWVRCLAWLRTHQNTR